MVNCCWDIRTMPGPIAGRQCCRPNWRRSSATVSFAAFRKVAQDDAALAKYLDDTVQALAARGVNVSAEYLKAKLAGRWPNGAPLLPGVTTQPAAGPRDTLNNFDFTADPGAEGCPFGSDIRRTNPRADSRRAQAAPPDIPPRHAVWTEVRWHECDRAARPARLVLLREPRRPVRTRDGRVGRQGADRAGDRGDAKDPLVGHHDDLRAQCSIPRAAGELRLSGMTPFATTLGMLYAFYPSLSALGRLVELASAPLVPAVGSAQYSLAGGGTRTVARGTARSVSQAAPAPAAASPAISARTMRLRRRAATTPRRQTAIATLSWRAASPSGICIRLQWPRWLLAEHYRFKNIGGSSIGAFAAAVAAAAEYARRRTARSRASALLRGCRNCWPGRRERRNLPVLDVPVPSRARAGAQCVRRDTRPHLFAGAHTRSGVRCIWRIPQGWYRPGLQSRRCSSELRSRW